MALAVFYVGPSPLVLSQADGVLSPGVLFGFSYVSAEARLSADAKTIAPRPTVFVLELAGNKF